MEQSPTSPIATFCLFILDRFSLLWSFEDLKWPIQHRDFWGGAVIKNPPVNAGDARDPWVGKIFEVGNGNTLQYSCLENSTDRSSLAGLQAIGPQRVRLNWTHTHIQHEGLKRHVWQAVCHQVSSIKTNLQNANSSILSVLGRPGRASQYGLTQIRSTRLQRHWYHFFLDLLQSLQTNFD